MFFCRSHCIERNTCASGAGGGPQNPPRSSPSPLSEGAGFVFIVLQDSGVVAHIAVTTTLTVLDCGTLGATSAA